MALIKCKECGSKVSTDASACPQCGAKVVIPPTAAKKPRKWLRILVLVVLVWPLVILAFRSPDSAAPAAKSPTTVQASARSSAPAQPPAAPSKKVDPADLVKIVSYSARKGGFKNVMIVTFKLRNDNPYPVKDFQIVCGQYGQSGTELPATFDTLYERLEPGQTKTFKDVNMGLIHPQSVRFNCSIAVASNATKH